MLYKADMFFRKHPPPQGSRLILAVPSISGSFGPKRKRAARGAIEMSYPMADYFFAHNRSQNQVRLEILELQLETILRESVGGTR